MARSLSTARIVIAGPRTWSDRKAIVDVLLRLRTWNPQAVIVHGDAAGADRVAAAVAADLGLTVEPHPAAWGTCSCGRDCLTRGTARRGPYGPFCPAAGIARSRAMLSLPGVLGLLVCVPPCGLCGRRGCCAGTHATVTMARAAHVSVWPIYPSTVQPARVYATAPRGRQLEAGPADTSTPSMPEDEVWPIEAADRDLWDDGLRTPRAHTVYDPHTPGESDKYRGSDRLIPADDGTPVFNLQMQELAIDDPHHYRCHQLHMLSTCKVRGQIVPVFRAYERDARVVMEDTLDRPLSPQIHDGHGAYDLGQKPAAPTARPEIMAEAEIERQALAELAESIAEAWGKPKAAEAAKDSPRVYSRRAGAEAPPADAVYVGRPSAWGNPYHGPDRDENIANHRAYAIDRAAREPEWLEPLRGKHLVCWCHPRTCHADTLINLANAEAQEAAA